MTLAEAKRRLQVGTFVVTTYHKYMTARNKMTLVNVTRVVAKKQTNAVAFTFLAAPGARLSWLWWPKASEFKSDSDNEFSILENGEIVISYKILEPLCCDCHQPLDYAETMVRNNGQLSHLEPCVADDNLRSNGPHQSKFRND